MSERPCVRCGKPTRSSLEGRPACAYPEFCSDTLRARAEAAELRATRAEAIARLHLHIACCAQCGVPNDGCDRGQELEGICISDLGIDPYDEAALQEREDK